MALVAKESEPMAILEEHNAEFKATNSSTNSPTFDENVAKEPTMTEAPITTTSAKAPTLDAATVSTYESTVSSSTTSTMLSLPPQPVTPDGSKSYYHRASTLEEKENDPNSLRTVSMDEDAPYYPGKSFMRYPNAEDLSSSDDDSSYFATQLPAPNSRRGSYMSSASNNNNNYVANSTNDESNASLSFSDDESEEFFPNPHLVPRNSYNDDEDPITKIHSLSSLVSSTSSSDNHASRAESTSPLPRLLDGRHAPIMGQYFYPSPTPTMASNSSPPMIMQQGYLPSGGSMIHQPQPQLAQPGYGSTLLASQYAGNGQQHHQEPPLTTTTYGTNQRTTPKDSSFSSAGGGRSMGRGSGARANAPAPSQGTGPTAGGGGGADTKSDLKKKSATGGSGDAPSPSDDDGDKTLKVYWQRWIMLMYMSILNLLSDWTCYSVAPIALLTEKAFGDIDPERLVVVFLGANAAASACEPIILARLGLRKTVLFGSLLLMIGSLVKSGGIPPIIPSDLRVGQEEWRLYLGFFLVGLSQPLYQCTPALLSASWFPEEERTMATGVALNANQLGIGFAFVFGTLLVSEAEDIPNYFGLLTLLSTIVFLGTLIQFDDAPPTPPSASARVMRGDMNLPKFEDIMQSVRNIGTPDVAGGDNPPVSAPSPAMDAFDAGNRKTSGSTRRRGNAQRSVNSLSSAPSPALEGSTAKAKAQIERLKYEASVFGAIAPSPAMDASGNDRPNPEESSSLYTDANQDQRPQQGLNAPPPQFGENASQGYPPQGMMPPPGIAPYGGFPPGYQQPYWDPRYQQQMQMDPQYQQQMQMDPQYQQQMQQQMQQQQAAYQQFYYYQQQMQQQQQQMPPQMPQAPPMPFYYPNPYLQPQSYPMAGNMDEGAEPVITLSPHHLDIDIRDDQVILSIRACLSRPGFIHALVAFTVSGIVINTLSTYMDYLVRLNGAPRYYTGVIGGTFQLMIMISSLIIGKQTDKTRAYYSVTIGMLVLGAFGLAECGVSLDENKGRDLRWALVIVAVLVGPLQPVSTELGVDVAYPLSENTVLVIQQLFSNLLSALFIPLFKALKDVGKGEDDERPEYTFSFYLLIVLHTIATVFFATFNGKYLRYEHELEKKDQEEAAKQNKTGTTQAAFHPFYNGADETDSSFASERQPLVGA
ncbi:unnamed protein product [Cylindrotheca closterium]|uniref:Major facilitator superfamily (MFS) profile domain-containing protein n=1 Tax=Cylindrotheca closterium TaxID=2856 RepID=A0AAD2GBY7_9STRA|nr:unnamed protein product [Cylindrotheca closterium]